MKKFRIKWMLLVMYSLFCIVYTTVHLVRMVINLL